MDSGRAGLDDSIVTDRLLDLYRRYLGEPDQLSDVYIGFALFFAGVTFAAIGMVVFLWSATLSQDAMTFWYLREIAISLAMLGLPAFLLSVVVLLPVDRRAVYTGGAGAAVALVAVGIFVANYPYNWNVGGPDASAAGTTVYALGLVVSLAGVGAALVSNYIERSTPVTPDADAVTDERDEEDVTDEQVRSDIEEAMSAADLTWGGVERDDTERLTITSDDSDIDRGNFDAVGANESRAAGTDVDSAVAGLSKLQGGETETATGQGTDDQADALQQLRERQREEDQRDDRGLLDALRDRLGL